MSAGQVVAAAAAVAVAAGALLRRRRLGTERTVAAVLLAVALAVYASGALSGLPDAKQGIADVAQALGPLTYVLVGGLAFLETGAFVGLVAPGETVVIVGGVIAGQGEIQLLPLIGLVWLCAILGDSTSFLIGRRLGHEFILRHGPKVKITEDRLQRVEGYFQRHGGKTILIGRFIGLVRALAPFVAGSSGMAYRRFLPFSVVGTGLWAGLFTFLGYLFYRSFDKVASVAGQATMAFGLVVGVVVGGVYVYRRLRRAEERRRLAAWLERQGRRPLMRPLFAAARPVWRRVLRPGWRFAAPRVRFIWRRLTPGGLGLELTTALAVAGAGLYVFVLYTVLLSGDPGLTPFDRGTLDLADDTRAAGAVDVAKVVTELGAASTVGALLFVLVVALAVRRRYYEVSVLVVGSLLVFVGVQLTKAGIDRPRPPHPLVGTSDSSFPSGHAAYATAWFAASVGAARGLPGLGSRAALVAAGILITAAVGLSRIYLRAHYWSDVAGGFGLGFGVYGTCAAAALVVGYIRHNAERAEEAAGSTASAATR